MSAAAATLSPAQKAWETRRLRTAARSEIVEKKIGTDQPSPIGDARVVQLYVDVPAIGCGFRRFVVVDVGTKWTQLVYAPRLLTLRVDRRTFDRSAKRVPFKPRILSALIRSEIEAVKTRAIEPGEGARRIAAGKAALASLRAGSAS